MNEIDLMAFGTYYAVAVQVLIYFVDTIRENV